MGTFQNFGSRWEIRIFHLIQKCRSGWFCIFTTKLSPCLNSLIGHPCKMAPAPSVPSQIAGFLVLPIALPPLPSFPTEATHYLYLSPHQPKAPEPNAERSLFHVNVPFSSTEIHIKHLLSKQLGLPAGRIEEVRFPGKRREDGNRDESDLGAQTLPVKGKKRKRGDKGSRTGQVEGAELPSTWDRELLKGNLTAIVLFIDKSSASAVLKAAKRAKKEDMKPVWGEGLEDKVPPLGSARTSHKICHQEIRSC